MTKEYRIMNNEYRISNFSRNLGGDTKFIVRYSKILILLFLTTILNAQTYTLQLTPLDKTENFLKDNLDLPPSYSDSLAVVNTLSKVILDLHSQSYLEASIDSVFQFEKTYNAFVHIGAKYEWASLTNGNVEPAFLEQVGFRERLYSGKDFHYEEVLKLQESLLKYAENNGYPFAAVKLGDIEIQRGKIGAKIFMQKNKLVEIEEINIQGDAKISERYLENYLGIKKESLYSKEKVLKIKQRIRELPFVKSAKDPTITFKGDKATVNLFLQKKKASRFDFLIGVLPRSNNPLDPRRVLITGTFNADMHNQFGLGEHIFAEFQQLSPGTQELDLRFAYPYIMDLPFGADLKFNLYKRDSSYLDVAFDVGVQYLLEGGNYLKAFWTNTSTDLLTINQSQINSILNTKKLPTNIDVSNSTFGLEYNFQNLDYRFNPRKGWGILARAGAGFKNIKKNNSILTLQDSNDPTFDYETLYDSLNLKTFQYQFAANVQYYIPIRKLGAIKTSIQSGWIFSPQEIFRNEQYRLGGNRLLRGFDEETIFSTRYAILTMEARLLNGQNSYFFVFGDFGYTVDKTNETDSIDTPMGVGAGLTLETKAGLFGFSLALGKQLGNSFNPRDMKIHFGYVSLF